MHSFINRASVWHPDVQAAALSVSGVNFFFFISEPNDTPKASVQNHNIKKNVS